MKSLRRCRLELKMSSVDGASRELYSNVGVQSVQYRNQTRSYLDIMAGCRRQLVGSRQ